MNRTPLTEVYWNQALNTIQVYLWCGIILYGFMVFMAIFMDGLEKHAVFPKDIPFWVIVGWPVFLGQVFFGGGWHQ